MKTLILGTTYVGPVAQGYGLKVVELWAKLAMHLNPVCDILLIDSLSPADVAGALEPLGFGVIDELKWGRNRGAFIPSGGRQKTLFRLPGNPGHLNCGGSDGWGAAMSRGIELAIDDGYDYVAYMDSDIFVTQPVMPIIEKMNRIGVKAAIPWCQQYQFLENGIMFLDGAYLRDSKFVERYAWQDRKPSADPMDIPEMVTERLLADELFVLPMRTFRDDGNQITVNNLEHMFPYGLDALTHCRDPQVYDRFLETKGIVL